MTAKDFRLLIILSWLYGANYVIAGDARSKLVANLFKQIDDACNTSDSADHWRRPRMCGPIALYTYLRLHDCQCDFSDIIRSVTIDKDRGTSFLDLQHSATRFGVESQITRIPDGDLMSARFPAIAHMSVPREGHYVVLLKVAEHEVLLADPIAGMVEARDLDRFRSEWSGVLMVSNSKVSSFSLIEICVRVSFLATGYIVFLTWRKARRFRADKKSVIRCDH